MCDTTLAVDCRHVQKCDNLLGLSVNVVVGSCIDDRCMNGGFCLAYTKDVYSYAACKCIAGTVFSSD